MSEELFRAVSNIGEDLVQEAREEEMKRYFRGRKLRRLYPAVGAAAACLCLMLWLPGLGEQSSTAAPEDAVDPGYSAEGAVESTMHAQGEMVAEIEETEATQLPTERRGN